MSQSMFTSILSLSMYFYIMQSLKEILYIDFHQIRDKHITQAIEIHKNVCGKIFKINPLFGNFKRLDIFIGSNVLDKCKSEVALKAPYNMVLAPSAQQ